ncbi:Polyadenylate-binding protein 7 [Capsicum annuum]|uniref:Polyadenylate-binding protein n=1 Tax=Capsicum annuum TaxID=4072 RepID=A0A1U8EIJ9_CAPAN|nr:polyadenylate-binding protein 7 isoform X1 [Capsicum annuum]KAF3613771.1 Polyadenylate-binding protein 7 [Capsicum annuum]PHT70681.1 Polyadenylate-binding protein 7 [Capsicum annuum]
MALAPTTVLTTPSSLYVGDLHPDVSDGQLFDFFSEFKSLASVRVCRDSSTGRSLCYGYVNFVVPQDAVHAIEVKNNSILNGKVIRVSWSLRDPDARKSGKGNVFIKNLSDTIESSKLQEIFQKFGNILSCKVVTSEDGKSKGYGFVQFGSEESANAAIEKLNGIMVGDKQLYVGKFVKKTDRVLPNPDAKYTNLYFKNLDTDILEDHLREKFSKFGSISSLVISRDESGTSKGFGFVNFDNPDDARKAVEAMNGSPVGSKTLYVARAQKKAEREQLLKRLFEQRRREQIMKYQVSNVYVKNIDDDVSDTELHELFSQCGTITSSKIMQDEKGVSKGFGFVCFSTAEEAYNAVNTFYGLMLHRKPLYVAIAQRKEERQAQLQLHHAQRIAGLTGPSPMFPGAYPPFYYTGPGVVPQVPTRPGMMYHTLGMRPGWGTNGFTNMTRPGFQPSPVPMIPNTYRQHRQNRGRLNGNMPASDVISVQQSGQSGVPSKEASNSQRGGQVKYVPNGRTRDMTRGSLVSNAGPVAVGSVAESPEMLSSLLAAAAPEQQKQILGERLYPLVIKHKPKLAAKITGMLLEMDNAELLLLLESPESLETKVEEAVEVLKFSKAKVSSQESLQPSFLSAEVAVS